MKSEIIRKKFLDFFASKGHAIVPSSPMVVKDDPTLMFTNAGMNQFKNFFLGNTKPNSPRIANTQKCLRVSGKHNDLEEVGIDTYHHTFFEMLGNWSFGDYFKKEAIEWAWELLTEIYQIDKENLYVTVFKGDKSDGLSKDSEAFKYWSSILPIERILYGDKKDNFWEMGDQGPCGPCSEIHIDIRSDNEKSKIKGNQLINKDHPQVIELWNLVFIEFNRNSDGSLNKLPAKHIDTGMGFERLCMVLQKSSSNYNTDIFKPIILELQTITNYKYGKNNEKDIAIRVIADHVRSVYFAIADGQLPSNNGAGYVIRRILRRAIRYGFTFLNQKKPFIHLLVSSVSKQMSQVFPELKKEIKLAENVIREEEKSFLNTLDQGIVMLNSMLNSSNDKILDGKKVFELYDTFGFPLDLTSLIAREKNFKIDEAAFNTEMSRQKERSKSASVSSAEDWQIVLEDDLEEFVGYDILQADVKITRYRKMSNKKDGHFYQLVFNLTPFYPEGGGQVGDKGYLQESNGTIHYITDTKNENNLIIHFTKTIPQNTTDTFKAVVDSKQRKRTASNHTGTHLMHQALRAVLGNHVEQKGSMVHSGMFRFDFSHFSKLSNDEIVQVESFVNARIKEQLPLEEERNIPYKSAIEKGAIALFGEKYGDTVRTIRFGQSIELCGGCHVKNTSEIWYFKILNESAIASGVRRIEAITGDAVISHFEDQSKTLQSLNTLIKKSQDPLKAFNTLIEENSELRKELKSLTKLKIQLIKSDLVKVIKKKKKINFAAKEIDLDQKYIRDLAFELGKGFNNLFLVLASKINGKAFLSCYISKELVKSKGFNASKIVKTLSEYIGGSGGGQSFYATAGGKKTEGIEKAIKFSESLV
ncbi:MAG: alanine--tRNA ligase [Flavobacteriaceae bacterium]|nr:alanine--tRNA ligase [Flavobacteriaceae bacterium]|tara:strand:- start:6540 stop:9149 length:2610 start_codon:yes stop_codon:yes gene_type:complete